MEKLNEIYEKAAIREIADFLLHEYRPGKESQMRDHWLEEAYERMERAADRFGADASKELQRRAYEIACETARIYLAYGLQAGVWLIKDMVSSLSCSEESKRKLEQLGIDDTLREKVLEEMYGCWLDEQSNETLQNDAKYQRDQEQEKKALDEANERLVHNREEWQILDRLVTAEGDLEAEYGRIAYRQGVLDTISMLKK